MMGAQEEFANLVQATSEDHAVVTNLTMANLTLSNQVAFYDNSFSTKYADNKSLQTVRNL